MAACLGDATRHGLASPATRVRRGVVVTFADAFAKFVGLSEEEKKAEMQGRIAFREAMRGVIAKWARKWR